MWSGVEGATVRAERQHRVRPDAFDDLAQPRDRLLGVDLVAATVGIVEPVVLGDADLGEAGGEFLRAYLRELGTGWPTVRVGRAQLAVRRGDTCDASAGAYGGCHEPGAAIALVVGVCPDRQDGAQVGRRGTCHVDILPWLGPFAAQIASAAG
jgi:hypothetical protein